MSEWQLKCFLEWLMCSDPWPTSDEARNTMVDFANEESRRHNHQDWLEAYHAIP